MTKLKRYPAVVGLLLTLLLSLTACIHLDRSVTLNGDGSGSYLLTIGYSEQLVSLAGDQITSSMNGFGDTVRQQGGSYRHYEDTGYSYWAYTRPFKTIAQLNQLVQEAPQVGNGPAGASPASQDTLTFTEQPGFLSNTFHVTGHMSLVIPQSDLASSEGIDLTPYLKDMRESFAVTMPGSIISHQGGVVSGDTVTYTIHFGEETTIDVVGGDFDTTALLPLGIGLLVIILLLVIVGALLWRRRTRARALAQREQPGAPAYAPVYTPPFTPPFMPAGPDAPTAPGTSEPTSGAH